MARLPSEYVDLVYEALLQSYWRKSALAKFLRHSGVSARTLADWHQGEETKRVFLDRLFPKLEEKEKGRILVQQMGRELSEQTSFPDLGGWEDSSEKLKRAREAVTSLRKYVEHKDRERASEKETREARKRAQNLREEAARSRKSLGDLDSRLQADLTPKLGTQNGGYEFEKWFYDLMDFFEVISRRPYVSGGRQIDGTITVEGTTYLVELKFTASQVGVADIDSLLAKVGDKADNTMGILVSMSGFTSQAIAQASGRRTPLLLMDFRHIYAALGGTIGFSDIVRRIRRHSSQTGEAYLVPEDFGG